VDRNAPAQYGKESLASSLSYYRHHRPRNQPKGKEDNHSTLLSAKIKDNQNLNLGCLLASKAF